MRKHKATLFKCDLPTLHYAAHKVLRSLSIEEYEDGHIDVAVRLESIYAKGSIIRYDTLGRFEGMEEGATAND